ncbi:MAG: hypothetical protein MRJ92_02320 [Nitrospira sp.]|nr:hypothetical protein [Nitrospira sp.]
MRTIAKSVRRVHRRHPGPHYFCWTASKVEVGNFNSWQPKVSTLLARLFIAPDGRLHSITDLFAMSMPFYQSGIPKNAKVVQDMRLGAAGGFREIGHAFFAQPNSDSKMRRRVASPMALKTAAH